MNQHEFIWVEKYRPKNIEDIIIPEKTKNMIRTWITDGEIPNLLFSAREPGVGKSALANVLINEIGADSIFINSSLESNIDLLRDKIQGFVSTESFDGRPKIVVLDEADGLNPKSTQPALRAFIEEFSKQARFILTCNDKSKIIEPVRNRCIEIDFDDLYNKNKEELLKSTALRNIEILKNESIKYSIDNVKWVLKHFWPSNRKIINSLQKMSTTGELVVNEDQIDHNSVYDDIIHNIKSKDFKKLRNSIQKLPDPSGVFKHIYDNIEVFDYKLQPQIIVIVAKWASYDNQVRDRLINTVGCTTEIMSVL